MDSEVILRLFSIYEYSRKNFIVAGSMLNLSKKVEPKRVTILLNSWLENYLNEQIHFPKNNIKLTIDKSLSVQFDEEHLRQILNNLIQNALQHSYKVEVVVYYDNSIIIDVINTADFTHPVSVICDHCLVGGFIITFKYSGIVLVIGNVLYS